MRNENPSQAREEHDWKRYPPVGIFFRFSIWETAFRELTTTQIAVLIQAAVRYAQTGEEEDFRNDGGVMNYAWKTIKADINENLRRYREVEDRRRNALRFYKQKRGGADGRAKEGD